jgi:tetratricopeptide (TPR) repeat protein
VLALLGRVLLQPPPRLSEYFRDAPESVDALLARMLAKEPDERPADGREVAAALRALSAAEDPHGPTSSASAMPSLTDSEKRYVTVLLAQLDGDDTGAMLGRLRQVAERYGRAERVAGGGLLVTLVGDDQATDQAVRAARCALAMARATPRAGIAVVTGRAVLSDRLLVGELLDRAAVALRTGAGPVVDEVTAGLLGERFELRQTVKRLELVEERRVEVAVRTLLGKPVQCRGRERELATLEAIYDECCEEPMSNVVLVTGVAGSGKSLMRDALLGRLALEKEPPQVWSARGDLLGGRAPFSLLTQIVRALAGIVDGEALADRRVKLETLCTGLLKGEDASRVTCFLGEMIGTEFEGERFEQLASARNDPLLMGDQIGRAFEDLLLAQCERAPTLLSLDDLQWADLPSVQRIERTLRRSREQPLMVLALARPEVHDAFPRLWEARDPQHIRLGGLSKRHARTLVCDALGDEIAEPMLDTILARADGNPFFLEELVRSVAQGRSERLPETMLAMLQARVQEVEPEARRILRAAAVYGRSFWRGGLVALLGEFDAHQLDPWLRILCERELIERQLESRFDEEQYGFRHGLLREAAYAMLVDEDRELGHRLAGEWLEQAGEPQALVLAEHFERGADHARAAVALTRAAQQALEGHDFEGVLDLAQRGITCGAEGHERGLVRRLQAEAHRWLGHFEEGCDAARDAAELLASGSSERFRAIEEWLVSAGRLSTYADVDTWSQRAHAAPDEGAASNRLRALCAVSRVWFHAGDYQRADALIDEASRMLDDHDGLDAGALAEYHRLCGARARHVGDLVGDHRGYAASLSEFERAGDERSACNARVSVAFALVELGRYDEAEGMLRRALDDAERMGLSTIATRARQNLGPVLQQRGQLDEARALVQQAIDESIEQQNVRFEAWTRIYLARIEHQAGRLVEAEREARTAAEQMRVTPPARAGALAALAQVYLARKRTEDALRAAREAMEILERFGGIEEFEPLVRIALAEALDASGERAAAARVIAAAKQRIEALAAKLDGDSRNSFLANVVDNQTILKLAARWQVESS